MAADSFEPKNFIHEAIEEDLSAGKCGEKIHTRFPPEPNGYLHIGSAKAIWINCGAARKYGGLFNLRYDDTNPAKEDEEYVRAIEEDLRWLGAEPDGGIFYGSDYFDRCFEFAAELIKKGKAYVCDLSADEMRQYRGTLTEPGRESPFRNRGAEENLDLFFRMKAGEFEDGARTLRARIDMASPNMNMRDPAIYRIVHTSHHRQGDKWCIYPLYDYAHPIQDALEGITHSLCSIEFEDHRPLYDWVIREIGFSCPPRQIEFSRLNMTYTVMSKRYLRQLVEEGLVSGWDDPRMPTLSGLRRRGYTPEAIRSFCDRIGISKTYSVVDYSFLEHCIREDLNSKAARVMVVLDPIKLVVTNYPEGKTEYFEADNNPEDESAGKRRIAFTRECYIEAGDFMEEPPKGYFRLFPGNEVRLKHAYCVRCTGCKKDEDGRVVEVYAEYDPETGGGDTPDGRRIKGTIHWVSCGNDVEAEIRLYENLFAAANPADTAEGGRFTDSVRRDSLKALTGCKCEMSLKDAVVPAAFQFMRMGYFCVDNRDSRPGRLVFNRTVGLKDSWAKQTARN